MKAYSSKCLAGAFFESLLYGVLRSTYVHFRNDDRAPLLFMAGSDDNLMPPAVNESNVKHYRHTKSITAYMEFPGRSHYTVGQDGWEEVADYALKWAEANATRPAA